MSGAIIPLSARWRGRSVPLWPVLRQAVFKRRAKERARGRVVGSPIGTGQETRARHGRAATFPIPRADGHRQSETAHEILHGENLRVRAAFPLIATRGNRPFRSRGGTWTVRCNHVHVRSAYRFANFSSFLLLLLLLFYSILFHRRRVLPFVRLSHPAPRDFRAPPSLSLFRGYDHTLCTARHRHPQGGHSFVWYSTLTTRHFRADPCASLVPTARYGCIRARACVCVVHGYEERIRSLASILPAGIYVRTYVRTCRAQRKMFLRDRRGPRTSPVVLSLRRWRAAGLACVELGNCAGTLSHRSLSVVEEKLPVLNL